MAEGDSLAGLRKLLMEIDCSLDAKIETYKKDCQLLEETLKGISKPSPDHPYRITHDNQVYCFRTLEDLMSRVVIPEDVTRTVQPTNSPGASRAPSRSTENTNSSENPLIIACRTGRLPEELEKFNDLMEQYLHLRTTQRPSSQQKRCMDGFQKLLDNNNDEFKLFYGDLADEMDTFLKQMQTTDTDQVDHLKILMEKFTSNDDKDAANVKIKNELNEDFKKIQSSVISELVKYLKSVQIEDDALKLEIVKLATALRDLRTLKIPIMIKTDQL